MAFYENTIVVKQDLAEKDITSIKDKYSEIINNSSGKIVKIEQWGLLNLAYKIKNYKKGFLFILNLREIKKHLMKLKKKLKLMDRLSET